MGNYSHAVSCLLEFYSSDPSFTPTINATVQDHARDHVLVRGYEGENNQFDCDVGGGHR
jgi:hypothetical protein